MSVELEDFSFNKWYPLFERDSIESIFVAVPNDVLHYLRDGPHILPKEAYKASRRREEASEEQFAADWTDDDSTELEQPTFPVFNKKLKDAVNTLGGEVFIKMNWHAPQDAAWMITGRTLKCTSLEDIYLLLKSSDIISKDTSYEFKTTSSDNGYFLVVKRWTEMHPGCEFRCFVKSNLLIGISQRDYRSYYKHINANKYDILKDIVTFYKRRILNRFPRTDYVFDVARPASGTVVIVDFQPLDKSCTDGLLFSWEDLNRISEESFLESTEADARGSIPQEPEFRFLGEDPGIQPKPHEHSDLPYEMRELWKGMGGLTMMDLLLQEMERQDSDPE